MIDCTPIVRLLTKSYAKSALSAALSSEQTQRRVLSKLLKDGARTKWGKEHGLREDMTYEEYSKTVPVRSYEAFRPYVMRMVDGEADVLWPGVTRRFAQSSGTSGGKSKYIPITKPGLKSNHYAGASASVGLYLMRYLDSRMFAGKGLILGGSYANELSLPAGVMVGDLSANLIDHVGALIEIFRVPKKDVALMQDWTQKLPALIEASRKENITNISGVPSWFLTVLKGVLEKAQAEARSLGAKEPQDVKDVWPNLEVFFHGGIAFGPYKHEYDSVIGRKIRYWETYNASEGFFATRSEVDDPTLLLLQNIGVFYELVPLGQVDEPMPEALPAWKAEPGKVYALVITTCNGLWRYAIGDTVKVESVNPLKITVAGRTQHFINAFGEELMVCNTEAAIEKACHQMGCSIANYTVAPVYTEGKKKGRHQWLIEWGKKPKDIEAFALLLDQLLQRENSDYQAKRAGDIFLDRLEVLTAPKGLFDKWLASTGKLGGQRKVPRLSNDRKVMESMLGLMR